MPYLPTSQSYLEQSSLLLQAYPDTRITTKYTFPTTHPSRRNKNRISKPQDAPTATQSSTTPIATLTLKTFNPTAGISLKYRTNKAAEVGRLMLSLGKLAGGADVEGLGLGATGVTSAAAGTGVGDVEMVDVSRKPHEESVDVNATPAAGAKGGKSKKKGGKGKR